MFLKSLVLSGLALIAQVGFAWVQPVAAEEPIVIAHRGASGYRPEHTLNAYALAVDQRADFIEPDLVMTKDGVLVARHDVYLSSTTDIASRPEFAERKRTLGGKSDWYVFDFTLAELKTLRAVQPFKGRDTSYDGQFEIATFDEVIELVQGLRAEGRTVGLHIEMKRPDLFKQEVAPDLASILGAKFDALLEEGIPLYFQCFDGGFVREIAPQTDAPAVLLVGGRYNEDSKWYELDIALEDYYGVADGFGLNKALLFTPDMSPSGVMKTLHDAGKFVHVWTVRDDALPNGFESVEEELDLLFDAGVDGFFTDFPDTAVQYRNGR